MLSKEEQHLNDVFTKALKDTHRNGLLQGSKAMCHVILELASDTKKTPDERIEAIKKFCATGLSRKQDEKPEPQANTPREIVVERK